MEGKRDEAALRRLGYTGPLARVASLSRGAAGAAARYTGAVILTDLDREGGKLAAWCARALPHEGLRVSTSQRRRLLRASRGVFRHIENLGRFAEQDPV